MKDNLPKFALVGAMILATVFLNHQSRGEFENSPGERIAPEPRLAALEFTTIPAPTSSVRTPSLVPVQTSSLDIDNLLKNDDLDSTDSLDSKMAIEPVQHSASKKATLEKQESGVAIPVVNAAASAVFDLGTGAVYFSYKDNIRWPMASLTKLMTSAVATKNMSLNQEVTIEEEDFRFLEGAGVTLKVGDKYALGDLIQIMLAVSSNEAAEAISRTYGREGFIKAMNAQAKDWGMENTNFNDPTGISVSNQSTISDLYIMTREIYNGLPELFKITRKTKVAVKEIVFQKLVRFSNINNFAGRADFLGGKTGFTEEAQGNLISLFSLNGRPVMVVVLGTTDRFGESEKLWTWFKANYGH